MKVALIHDWLDKFGGAERVICALTEVYKFDYYYTYVDTMNKQTKALVFNNNNIRVEDLLLISPFKPFFRYLMPFFPAFVFALNSQTKKNNIDVVISSSWALSKGYRIGNEIHISYFQARNFKYVWEESDQYFKGPLKYLSFLKPFLQKFDIKQAHNPDYIIANSVFVQSWIKEKYNRESIVIYPPVEVDDFFISEKEEFYITVGRLEPYKRFDIVIDAFTKNGKKLIVIGDGSQMKYLKSISKSNIEFIGFRTKEEIKGYLSKAKGFVFAGVEDFGISIVEALASGTPVIAFNGGAALELIETYKNGIVFDIQSSDSLNSAISSFEESYSEFDKFYIRESSKKFSKKRFQDEIDNYINNILQLHNPEYSLDKFNQEELQAIQ